MRKKQYIMPIACVTILFVIIYHQYIWGDKLFMFTDIGFDTISIIHPYSAFIANSKITELGKYSFVFGLGGGTYEPLTSCINPSELFTYFLPSDAIAYAYIAAMYISTLIAGIFGYRIGKIYSKDNRICTIAALLFAFSGYISLWGQQPLFGSAYSLMIVYTYYLLTCSFEGLKKEMCLIVSLCLITLDGYYFLYMAGFFSALYLVVRGIYNKTSWKVVGKELIHLLRVGIITIFLCAFTLAPTLGSFLSSSRLSNLKVTSALQPVYSIQYLVTDIARLLSSNLLRIGNAYTGAYNYYEGTILWCSVLSVMTLIFALIYKRENRKKRIKIFIVSVVMLVCPMFTKMVTFDAEKQRWTYIYIIALIIICVYTLDDILRNKEKIGFLKWLVLSDVIFLLMLSGVLGYQWIGNCLISKRALVKILFFVTLYNILFLLAKKINKRVFSVFLLLVVCMDILLETYPIVNNRMAITKEQYENLLYHDGTTEGVKYIQNNDDTLCRMNKTYISVFLNDAMEQGYNGMASYNAVPTTSIADYMQLNDIPFAREGDFSKASKYILVPYDNYYINTLLGVKYLLAKDTTGVPAGYSLIEQVGAVYIYQNNQTLPFGYLYHNAISKYKYQMLDSEQKAYAMTAGFYLTDTENESEIISQYGAICTTALNGENADINISNLQQESMSDIVFDGRQLSGSVNNGDISDAMLCLPVFYDNRWSAYVDGTKVDIQNINGGLIGISIKPGEHDVQIVYKDSLAYAGIIITLATLGLLLLYLLLHRHVIRLWKKHRGVMIRVLVILGSTAVLFLICNRKNTCVAEVQDRINAGETVITQYGNDSRTETQYSFWTIENRDSFTIIDGGVPAEADVVETVIREHDNHVDNWIITHPHPDHMGAFNQIMSTESEIDISHIYTVEFPLEDYEKIARDVDDINTYYNFLDITQKFSQEGRLQVEYLHEGDTLKLGSSSMKVYSDYTPEIVERNLDLPNSSSLVFKISGETKSMLFWADYEDPQLADKLYEKYGEEMTADYMQLGHHGNNGFETSFYLKFHPAAVYADAPYFLYTGDQYRCADTLKYLSEHGVKCYTFSSAPNRVYLD